MSGRSAAQRAAAPPPHDPVLQTRIEDHQVAPVPKLRQACTLAVALGLVGCGSDLGGRADDTGVGGASTGGIGGQQATQGGTDSGPGGVSAVPTGGRWSATGGIASGSGGAGGCIAYGSLRCNTRDTNSGQDGTSNNVYEDPDL